MRPSATVSPRLRRRRRRLLADIIVAQLVAEAIALVWLTGGQSALAGRPQAPTQAATTTLQFLAPTSTPRPSSTASPADAAAAVDSGRSVRAAAQVIDAQAAPAGGARCPAPPAPAGPAATGGSTVPAGQRWALIVGVTHYEGSTHPTIGGAQDAVVVRDVLLRAGWLPDHILVLTNRGATAGAVCAGMAWLVAHSGPGTFTFMHYSGHVQQRRAHEYLWPVDNELISDTTVASLLGEVRGRAWFDFAGCESAGFAAGLATGHRLVSSSSRVNEKSYEVPQWTESVWAGLVFDLGMHQRAADANGDGVVTVGEALRYGAHNAPVMTAVQRPYGPQHPTITGGDNLDWSLSAPPQ